MKTGRSRKSLLAAVASLALLPASETLAQQSKTGAPGSAAAASEMADFFRQVGDQIYDYCIFELSQEQLEVQKALIAAYVKQGAGNYLARQLAVKQIQPPKLSDDCKQLKNSSRSTPWSAVATPTIAKEPKLAAAPPPTASSTRLRQQRLPRSTSCRNGIAPQASIT